MIDDLLFNTEDPLFVSYLDDSELSQQNKVFHELGIRCIYVQNTDLPNKIDCIYGGKYHSKLETKSFDDFMDIILRYGFPSEIERFTNLKKFLDRNSNLDILLT